ncbi:MULTISPECIES: helix-turn-helix transcriptional regulator [unclassified Micromonospora]|uniref:helix-turn-helix transcriptional regulator n=1 Tax=unclassified Micromonospora TaxID=2617518 RepID=UPI0033B5DF80
MASSATAAGDTGGRNWTFLTNHGHVLLAIGRDPTARLRDVAAEVGVTERAAQAIVADLEAGGYLRRTRVGRRNEYTLNPAGHFRHPAEADRQVGALLALFAETPAPEAAPRS